jgi:hypothetical protein
VCTTSPSADATTVGTILGISQGSQIDEEHRVSESINQRMSDRDCYSDFSDTAGTDNADEAPDLKSPRNARTVSSRPTILVSRGDNV